MSEEVSLQQIVDIITATMEPNEPVDTILRVFRENNGKRLDVRIERKLKEATGDSTMRITHYYNMTQIVWGHYPDTSSALVSYQIKNVYIDADDFKARNPAWFDARDNRNAQRLYLLERDDVGILKHAETLLRVAYIINQYRQAHKELEDMLKEDAIQVIEQKLRDLTFQERKHGNTCH